MQVNIHEAKTNLSLLIEKVLKGQEVIIAKNNNPVIKLTKIEETKFERKIGSAKGQIWMAEDFDEPLEEFKDYM